MISDRENPITSEQNEQPLGEMTPSQLPATVESRPATIQHNLIMSSLVQQNNNDDGAAGGSVSDKSGRRVSFPAQKLVTGYFEASNPFAHIRTYSSKELLNIYQASCQHHETTPMACVLDYLSDLELVEALCRSAVLNLRDQQLTSADCEALEAILKRVQFRIIDLNNCGLDDASASSLFDMIEYYEATIELDVSYNPKITIRGWQSMVSMIKKSQALKTLAVRGFPISISMAANLGQALMVSFIHTLKLEHCGLAGRPIANLCTSLKNNSVLKELWLGHNDLTVYDSYQIGVMLQSNHYLQLLDISNNNIMDEGAGYITSALVQQSIDFQQMPVSTSTSSLLNISDLSASLHSINTSTARYSPVPKLRTEDIVSLKNSNNLAMAAAVVTVAPTKLAPAVEVPPAPEKILVETTDLIVFDDSADLLLKAPTFEHNDSITKNSVGVDYLQQTDEKQQPDIENNLTEAAADAPTVVAVLNDGNNGLTSIEPFTKINEAVLFSETTPQCCDSDKCTKTTDDCGKVVTHVDCGVNNNNLDITSDKPICDNVDLLLTKEDAGEVVEDKAEAAVEATEKISDEVAEHIKKADDEVLKIFETPDNSMNNNNNTTGTTTSPPSPSKRQSDPIQIINNNTTDTTLPPISQSLKVESTTPRFETVAPLSQSLDDDFNRAFLEQHQYPERSFSSESLNSEASNDSNDSKSSIKLAVNKFTNKYGTLERQSATQSVPVLVEPNEEQPQKSGLQVLVLWNNGITRNAARSFAELFAQTSTLEIINVGRNNLSNEFLANVKESLKANQSLTNLGLQSAHLTCEGAKTLSEAIGFGGNATLQRIDMRDNNIKTAGLTAIDDAMKSNKTVTRIDLDDEPRCRFTDDALELNNEYTRLLNSIRAQCSRNENPPERPEPISSSTNTIASPPITENVSPTVTQMHPFRSRSQFSSRKISLTCHNSVRQAIAGTNSNNNTAVHPLLLQSDRNSITTVRASSPEVFSKSPTQQLLDPLSKKSTSTPLRSPMVSPIPSPMSSPVPSPSRSSSRFRVVKVKEPASPGTTSLPSRSPTSTGSSPTFFPNSRFRVVAVSEPNLLKDTTPVPPAPIVASPLVRTKHHTQSLSSLLTNSPTPPPESKTATMLVTPPTVVPPPINVIQEPPTSPLPLVVTVVDSPTNSSKAAFSVPPLPISSLADQPPAVVEKKSYTISGPPINLTDTLPILSTSFDSPETDLEVKKYMDLDSCSSISSSIESINNHPHHHHHHHHPHLHRSQPNSEFLCNTSVSSIDSYDFITTDKLQRHQMDQKQVKQPVVIETSASYRQISDSFDTASMSDDSLSGVVEASSVLSSSPHVSSNEGTLTNSPCLDGDRPVVGEEAKSVAAAAATVTKPVKTEKRVRKTSWIANANPTNYPATLDKLLNLFQHPGSLFTRSSPDTTKKEDKIATEQQPTRKDSPMGGLFSWGKKDVPTDSTSPEPAPVEPFVKDEPHDVKENISPNSTITAATPTPLGSRPLADNVTKSKVIFELGSDDDSSSTTDPNEPIETFDEKPSTRLPHMIEKSDSEASVAPIGGLGQIARDSMNALTAHLERLQDSPKKSFETVHEDREVVAQQASSSGQPKQSQ